MKEWVRKQTFYSLDKLFIVLVYFYEVISSFIFSVGGSTNMGGHFSATTIVYVIYYIKTVTPAGRIYFSVFFRSAILLLLSIRLFHEVSADYKLFTDVKQEYAVAFVVLLIGLAAFVLGVLAGKNVTDGKKKTRRDR